MDGEFTEGGGETMKRLGALAGKEAVSSVEAARYLGRRVGGEEEKPGPRVEDTVAERLRRRPAKPMGSPRVGSNPTGVVL